MNRAARWTARVLLVFCMVGAGVFPARAMRLPLVPYTSSDGLPSDSITAVVPDPDGLVWIGTDGGLALWDGDTFRPFGSEVGLDRAYIVSLARGADGTIWVASDRGVFRLDRGVGEGTLQRIHLEGDDGTGIGVVYPSERGRVWLANRNTLFALDPAKKDARARRVPLTRCTGDGRFASPRAMTETEDGALWVGFRDGAPLRLAPDGACSWPSFPVLGMENVRALLPEPGGKLWAATYRGVFLLRVDLRAGPPEILQGLAEQEGLPALSCLRLARSRTGEIMVGTEYGLAVLSLAGSRWTLTQTVTAANGLTSEFTRDIAEDAVGNVWIATAYQGLRIWVRRGFERMDEVSPPGLQLMQVGGDGAGGVFVLSRVRERHFRLDRWTGDRHEWSAIQLPPQHYPGWGSGDRALVDDGRTWWIGTGNGICRWRTTTSATLPRGQPDWCAPRTDPLIGWEVFNLVRAGDGTFWITSYPRSPAVSALAQFDPRTLSVTAVPRAQLDLREPYVRLAITKTGTVWTTRPGSTLTRYREGRVAEVLDPGAGLAGSYAWNLFLDSQGRLWVLGQGISVCSDPDAANPVFETPAWSQEVLPLANCAVEDVDGRLWIGTQRGVLRVSRDGTSTRRFTEQDGLPSTVIEMCFRDDAGQLWFGDGSGVSRLTPTAEDPPSGTGAIRIWSVHADGAALPVSPLGSRSAGPFTLHPGASRLSLTFGMPGFHGARKPSYQFQVEKGGPWSSPSPERRVEIVGFRPGLHRIAVRAVGDDGAPIGETALVEVSVLAPLWRRPWFLSLVGIVAVGLVWAAFRMRLRRAVALERMRTRIATDLHDDIGSTLSQIAVLSQVAGGSSGTGPEAARILDRITGLSGDVVDALSDVVWSINPARDRVRDLVQRMRSYASELFSDQVVEVVLHLPDHADARTDLEFRRQVYLVFKEALNNVRRHAGAKRVEVTLRGAAAGLHLAVKDDGRGFDPAATSGGHGFASMRERARRVGGSLEVHSAPGSGTEVVLRTGSYPRRRWWPWRSRRILPT